MAKKDEAAAAEAEAAAAEAEGEHSEDTVCMTRRGTTFDAPKGDVANMLKNGWQYG